MKNAKNFIKNPKNAKIAKNAKKFAVKAASALTAAFIAVCGVVTFALPSRAYIDPTIVSTTIQAVAGVAVAVGAVFAILWRKLKKKTATVLHIDENAKKDVEEDIVELDGAEQAESADDTESADADSEGEAK